MAPERSNPLHNFNLPSRLRWGTQRYLRCKKDPNADDPQQHQPNRVQRSDDGSRIEAIGQKLMLDFKLKMDNLKVVVGGGVDAEKENEKVVNGAAAPLKRVRGGIEMKEEKVTFRVPLKREEVERDFLVMVGTKPRRRPKKRPRAIQKELDMVFPGLWLTDVTPEKYDVAEATES